MLYILRCFLYIEIDISLKMRISIANINNGSSEQPLKILVNR